MQENNNENEKTLNENDVNDIMQNSENTETNDTEETVLLLSVKKTFPKAD